MQRLKNNITIKQIVLALIETVKPCFLMAKLEITTHELVHLSFHNPFTAKIGKSNLKDVPATTASFLMARRTIMIAS